MCRRWRDDLRSRRLVRRQRLKVASLVVLATALALASGPLVGALLIVLTSLPFGLLNVVAGVVWAIALPFVALTTVYVYFDTLVRERLEPDVTPGELPAEIPVEGEQSACRRAGSALARGAGGRAHTASSTAWRRRREPARVIGLL